MNILIVGAGPAGLTLAYWLRKYGFHPTIIERAPSLPIGGYKIDVRGIALDVLRQMNIYDEVLTAGTDMQGAMLINKNGKVVQEMGGEEFGHREGDDLEIIRGELCKILMHKVPDIDYIFGQTIEEVKQSSDGVEVKLTDGSTRSFDLLVGADGLHSKVRKLVFGNEDQFLHDLGMYLCVYTVPNFMNLDRVEVQYTEFGRIALAWSAKGEPQAKACFAFRTKRDIDRRNRAQQEQIIKDIYSDVAWEVPKLLQYMSESDDFYFDSAAQIRMDKIYKDRVVLLGDAGYCASPMSGQGTSLALVGAYILAGELKQAKANYQLAFENYQKAMRPFIDANQAVGVASANRMKTPEEYSLFDKLMNKLLQIMPGPLVRMVIHSSSKRIQKAANAIKLKNYHMQ